MKTSGLSLRFILNDKHFHQGKLKLKCIASVPLYNIQNEANKIVKDYQYRHELLQYFASSSSSSSASSSASESQGLYIYKDRWWKEYSFHHFFQPPIFIHYCLLYWHKICTIQFELNRIFFIWLHKCTHPYAFIHSSIHPYDQWTKIKSKAKQNALFKIIKSFSLGDEMKIDFGSMFFSFFFVQFFRQTVRMNLFLNFECMCVYLSLTCERQSNWVSSLSQKHFYSSSFAKRLQIYFFFSFSRSFFLFPGRMKKALEPYILVAFSWSVPWWVSKKKCFQCLFICFALTTKICKKKIFIH